MPGLPPGATFGDLALYCCGVAVGVVLALLMLALLSESLIKIARALGSALISLPAVLIPFCDHMEDAVCDLATAAIRVSGGGWAAIMAVLDLILFLALASAEFIYFATRVAGMVGAPLPQLATPLGILLGVTFTATTGVIALQWKDEHDKAAATGGKSTALRWVSAVGWLLIIDAMLLGVWTTEVVFAGRNDTTVGALFLILLGALVAVAVALTVHGAIRGAVVVVGLLLYLLWPLLYLLATIAYFSAELVARVVAILEQILAAPRELGRLFWNQTPSGKANPIGPRTDLPLINAELKRPQLRRTSAPPAPVVPPTPVVSPGAPQSAPPNGKTPGGAAPSSVCARCGGPLSATARFCGRCGAGPLSSSNPPNPGASAKANAP